MADSLVLASMIELMGGGVASALPQCTGATFYLGKGPDMGAYKPQTELVQSILLDGERPTGRRSSNRQVTLPLSVRAPTRALLAAARETLLAAVDQPKWTLVYTLDGGQPLVYDCYRATDYTVVTDPLVDKALACRMTITFPASPYGRSDTLTTLTFPGPSVSWPVVPIAVRADDYSAVSSSSQAPAWSQSAQHALDSYSAHWAAATAASNVGMIYTHTLGASVDLSQQSKLSWWFGLGTSNFWNWHRGNVVFAVTLTDNAAHTLTLGGVSWCESSNDPNFPRWNQVTFSLPAAGSFDYTHVASYVIKAWRKVDCAGHLIMDADCYLNGLTGTPSAVAPIASVRGNVYALGDPGGTARALISTQYQSVPKTAVSTQTWSTAGPGSWTPPAGVHAIKVRVRGASGRGGDRTTSGAGGGAGGGAVVAHDTYPVTPGQPVGFVVGAAGTSGGYPTLAAQYIAARDCYDNTSVVTQSFTPVAGEIIVVKALNGSDYQSYGTPTGGGLTFTSRVLSNPGGNYCRAQIWTATVGGSPTPMTVTLTTSGSGDMHAILVERWSNAKLAGSPAVSATNGNAAPSGTVTTVANNSIVTWCVADWNAGTGARTYRGSPTEEYYRGVGGDYTGYWAYQQAASAGAQTIGLTAPSFIYSMVGMEIQALNTGALTDGGDTLFDGQAFVADGGKSVPVNTATGGLGGILANCVIPAGGVGYRGGNGFTGSTTGGGGGSAAGDDAQGVDAASQTGATAPTGGGNGGNGGNAGGNNAGAQGTSPAGAGGGAFSTGGSASGANGRDGSVQIWWTPPLTPFKTLLVHAPSYNAPDTLNPLVPVGSALDPPDGREYAVASPVAGLNARFAGTYTVVAMAYTIDSPSASRTLTVTVSQYDYPGGAASTAVVSRTYTPNSESPPIANGVVVVGELSLPVRDIAEDQTAAYFTVKVSSTNSNDRFLDVVFCDVAGQTILVNSANAYSNYYLDEPAPDRQWGRVLGSVYERSQAVGIFDQVLALSGGSLMIDPDGPGWMLAYSPDAGAPALTASFYPRWRDSRLS